MANAPISAVVQRVRVNPQSRSQAHLLTDTTGGARTVISPIATATASGYVSTLSVLVPTVAQATATGSALTPTLIATVVSPQAISTASGYVPVIAVVVISPIADSTASSYVPTIFKGRIVISPIATATSSGYVPVPDVLVPTAQASATASGLIPTLIVTVVSPQATATASGLVPVISVVVVGTQAVATASALIPTLTTDRLILAAIASATGTGLVPTLAAVVLSPQSKAFATAGMGNSGTAFAIDSFNRADEGPPPTLWSAWISPGFQIISNQLAPSDGSDNGAVWNETQAADVEAAITIPTLPATGGETVVAARLNTAGGGSVGDAYGVQHVVSAGTDTIKIFRYDDSVATQLASYNQDLSAGNKLGIRCVGPLIEAWIYTTDWFPLGTVYDNTYSGAAPNNQLGLYHYGNGSTTARYDDWYANAAIPYPKLFIRVLPPQAIATATALNPSLVITGTDRTVVATQAIATATGYVPVISLVVMPPQAIATASGLVPTLVIGPSSVTIIAPLAIATATALISVILIHGDDVTIYPAVATARAIAPTRKLSVVADYRVFGERARRKYVRPTR